MYSTACWHLIRASLIKSLIQSGKTIINSMSYETKNYSFYWPVQGNVLTYFAYFEICPYAKVKQPNLGFVFIYLRDNMRSKKGINKEKQQSIINFFDLSNKYLSFQYILHSTFVNFVNCSLISENILVNPCIQNELCHF